MTVTSKKTGSQKTSKGKGMVLGQSSKLFKITKQPPSQWPWPKWIAWTLAAVVLLVVAVFFARPVQDGDFWFHLTYAEYMFTHHTLIPDHTIYSWTPSTNSNIYCAWLGEMVLYFLYKAGGLPLIYGLVYACVALYIMVCFYFAYRLGLTRHPIVWLAILIGLPMSSVCGYQKPEIFSYVLMCVSAGVWFGIKIKPQRWWLCYVFPVIMLIWVNAHGAFIFGLFFFFLIGLGEILNLFFALPTALPKQTVRHLSIALILAGISILITPYGITYPLQLLQEFLKGDELLRMVRAYDPVFSSSGLAMHLLDYFFIAAFLLLILFWQAKLLDLSLLMANIALGWLFFQFLRTTFFWVPVFVLSVIYLLSRADRLRMPSRGLGLLIAGLSLCLSLFIGGRVCFDAVCRPPVFRWCGFGIGYQNPVIEAEFLTKYHPGTVLGNTYDTGGYLLWDLWPQYKVMIDPRYFPFEEWLADYFTFEQGKDFNKFLERFPCDVFVVDYRKIPLLNNFLYSPDWHCAFFGPSGAVFVKRGVTLPEEAKDFGKERFKDIRNLLTAIDVFGFAMNMSDYSAASQILDATKKRFICPVQKGKIEQCQIYYDALMAYRRGEYNQAIVGLEAIKEGKVMMNNGLLVNLRNWQTNRLATQGEWKAALDQALSALSVNARDLYALFNAGSLGWALKRTEAEKQEIEGPGNISMMVDKPEDWRFHLQQFLRLYGSRQDIPEMVLENAREVLDGRYQGKPIVIAPTEPPKIN